MNLTIKQSTSSTENLTSANIVETLYQLTKPDPVSGLPAADAVLKGRIQVPSAYEDSVNFLNTQFSAANSDNGSDFQVSVLNNNYYIRFADPAVEEVLKSNMGKDENEGITTTEASGIVANYFQNNTDIESFDELKYFATPSDSRYSYNFTSCTALKSIDITGKEDRVNCNGNNSIEYFYGINGPKGFLSTYHTGVNFSGCGGITTLELTCTSNMVTNAYRGMGGLQTLIWKLSPGVVSGPYSFYNSPLLERVIVDDLDSFWTHNMGWGNGSPFQNKVAKLIVNDVEVTSVAVPQTITQIQNGNWRGARLTSCTFHSNITSIGDWAFGECDNLVIQDLNLPNLTTLGTSAFQGTKVQAISDLGNITTIPNNCFRQISTLTNVIIPNTVTSIGEYAFYNCSSLTSITIGSGVTSIGYGAFEGCSGLTSLTIPNSVTIINERAFYGCSGLTSVTIGNGITAIRYNAFYGCSRLVNVYLIDLAAWCGISYNSNLLNSNNNWHHLYLNGVEIINLNIPSSVTSIGGGAFMKCSYIASVVIPDNVNTIGSEAFAYDYSLTSVTIGIGVTEMSSMTFYQCTALTSITITATTPPTIARSSFEGTNNCPIYVPAGSVSAYQTTGNWTTYASRIQAIPT